MPRQFFTRISRQFRQKKEHPWYLKPFEFLLTHPVYFSTSRRGIAGALWIGFFIGLLPIPAHTFLAIMGALLLRVNVPVAAVSTWITNPVTFVPIYYFEYKLGTTVLNMPAETMSDNLCLDCLMAEMSQSWQPLMIGSILMAVSIASVVYLLTSAVWHITTLRRYRLRHTRSVGSIKGGKRPPAEKSD